MEITWLGHGTFQFRLPSGQVIVMDPWVGNPAYPKGYTIPKVDTICISHGHFDHIHDAVPLATDRTQLTLRVRARPGTDGQPLVDAIRAFLSEDIEACRRLQEGVRSPSFDLGPLAAYTVSKGYMQNSWFLIDVEAGFEPWTSGQGLTADAFNVTVH